MAASRDAMIHGTGIARDQDGSLSGWKSPETLLAWRMELPRAGAYHVRVLLKPAATNQTNWLEAMIAERVLRADVGASATHVQLGEFRVSRAGPRLLFLRAGGTAGPEGFAVVRGVELTPEK